MVRAGNNKRGSHHRATLRTHSVVAVLLVPAVLRCWHDPFLQNGMKAGSVAACAERKVFGKAKLRIWVQEFPINHVRLLKEDCRWDNLKWMLRCCDFLFFRTDVPISFLGCCFSISVDTFESKLFLLVRDLEISGLSLQVCNNKPANAENWWERKAWEVDVWRLFEVFAVQKVPSSALTEFSGTADSA